ncbi:MAG TPA: pyrroline-5-carboxylate reductase dimerization domain-containing protein, partial [Bdellovibrio sp.]
GYLLNDDDDDALDSTVADLFAPLGRVIQVSDEDQFEALMISCSSGTGFVFEMMMYWQDWIEEHGFSKEEAQMMTIETFVGASLLAAQAREGVEELQARVTSKKGVTAAGLQSMRELEIERALRISFEKAAMRNKEMAREIK